MMTSEREMVPPRMSVSARGKKQSAWYLCEPISSMAVAVGIGTKLNGVTLQRVFLRSSVMAAVGKISSGDDASIPVSGFSSNEVSPGIWENFQRTLESSRVETRREYSSKA